MKTPSFPSGRAWAFTLVELLVSMSVLVLLMVMVLQMINGAMALTTESTKRLDADSQARLAFDRMAVDFSQIVKRQDVDYYLQKNGSGASGSAANDQMAFYSETSGYYPSWVNGPTPKSNAALVGYRIFNHQLQRLNKALIWNGVVMGSTSGTSGSASGTIPVRPMTFLPQTLLATWPSIAVDDPTKSQDPDYQVIGDQVFRMEMCYLVRNAANPSAKLSETPYLAATTSPIPYNALRDVVAVVVTLAVLDNTSQVIVAQPTEVGQPSPFDYTATLLEDSSVSIGKTPSITPASVWQSDVDNGTLVDTGNSGHGLPKAAASRVRIYERYFYLGNAQ